MAQCTACNNTIPDGAAHCPACGVAQQPPAQQAYQQPPAQQGYQQHVAQQPGHAQPQGAQPAPGQWQPQDVPVATAGVVAPPAHTTPQGGSPPGPASIPAGAPPKKGGVVWLVLIIIGLVLGSLGAFTAIYGMVETKPNYKSARYSYLRSLSRRATYRRGARYRRLRGAFAFYRYKRLKSTLAGQALVCWALGIIGLILALLGWLVGKRKLGIAALGLNVLVFIFGFVVFPW